MEAITIKVPSPFSGITDLGFSARYPEQGLNERIRDVPFIIEGSALPMRRLVERLSLFMDKDHIVTTAEDEAYSWTAPIQLSDELCVLSFHDRSLMNTDEIGEDSSNYRGYIWNLVRPSAFTFLRDCVRIGSISLNEQIVVVVDNGIQPTVDLEIARHQITPDNGTVILQS